MKKTFIKPTVGKFAIYTVYIHNVKGVTLSPTDAYRNVEIGSTDTFSVVINNLIPP